MKKILLTLICGFGFIAVFAQEPGKVAKKKAAKIQLAGSAEAAKIKMQKKTAIVEAEKTAQAAPAKGSKPSLTEDKAN